MKRAKCNKKILLVNRFFCTEGKHLYVFLAIQAMAVAFPLFYTKLSLVFILF
jgi:hypothetical protein